ncbi:acyl carrier protein [Clostridium botulinum]|nr:acyl carrier protein [Clostridium botulinum]WCJ72297.1 acyl carrier protein [Clostridium botulinum]WCJ76136.1 acyl carrier protein [Clostridium botulinum]WCJ79975.1 acyl carrier protein [Clostridium botulinum]
MMIMIDNNTKIRLKKQIKKYLSELMDINVQDIMDDVDLTEMGATSMVIVQLYVILQEEYGISLDATVDLYKSISLNEIVENIEKTKIDLEDIVR